MLDYLKDYANHFGVTHHITTATLDETTGQAQWTLIGERQGILCV